MNVNIKKINKIAHLGFITAMLVILAGPLAQVAHAAALTSLSDTMSTVKIGALANHDIQFTSPTGVASGQTIILTFQSDFSIDADLDYTDIDVLDDGVSVPLATTPLGATWGAARTSEIEITLTNGTTVVGAGSVIRIIIGTNAVVPSDGVRQITNTTTTGTKTITISGTFTDTGIISVQIITDDAVNISGTVNQTIAFAINNPTIAFGTLTSANARYATSGSGGSNDDTTVAHALEVATNSTSGYSISVKGATLTSTSNVNDTITANGVGPDASSPGNEQFGIKATVSGGSNRTIANPYVHGSNFGYDGTATVADTFASGSSATTTTTYSLIYIANIENITEAGSYTASLIYVATGNF